MLYPVRSENSFCHFLKNLFPEGGDVGRSEVGGKTFSEDVVILRPAGVRVHSRCLGESNYVIKHSSTLLQLSPGADMPDHASLYIDDCLRLQYCLSEFLALAVCVQYIHRRISFRLGLRGHTPGARQWMYTLWRRGTDT